MTTFAWLLILAGGYHRPAVIVERFPTQLSCEAAAIAYKQGADKAGAVEAKTVCLEIKK